MMRLIVLMLLVASLWVPGQAEARDVVLGSVRVDDVLRVEDGVSAVVLLTPPALQDGERLVEVMLVVPTECTVLEGEAVPLASAVGVQQTRASLDAPGAEQLILGTLMQSEKNPTTLSFHLGGVIERLGSEPVSLGVYLTGCDSEAMEAALDAMRLEVRKLVRVARQTPE